MKPRFLILFVLLLGAAALNAHTVYVHVSYEGVPSAPIVDVSAHVVHNASEGYDDVVISPNPTIFEFDCSTWFYGDTVYASVTSAGGHVWSESAPRGMACTHIYIHCNYNFSQEDSNYEQHEE